MTITDARAQIEKKGKLRGFLHLIRPINCTLMGFAVIVGASLIFPLNFSFSLFLGFITSFMLTGASMTINDYYDRDIDAINEPNRPIPSGAVSSKEALLFALILSIIGFIAAFKNSLPCLVVAIFAWTLSMIYSTKGKRTGLLGNFLVSACVVIPFIYGGFVLEKLELPIITFVVIVFLSNTGREVAKGIVDVEGDRSQNIKTIAVLHGEKNAAVVSSIFFVSAVCLSLLPWLWGIVSNWFLPFVILTDFGLLASSFTLLRDHTRKNAKRVKNLSLVWFITGLLAFIAGAFR